MLLLTHREPTNVLDTLMELRHQDGERGNACRRRLRPPDLGLSPVVGVRVGLGFRNRVFGGIDVTHSHERGGNESGTFNLGILANIRKKVPRCHRHYCP